MKLMLVIIIVATTINACTLASNQLPSEDSPIDVVSLREHYPRMVEVAQEWNSNAYLSYSYVNLYDDVEGNLISAEFRSPSEQSISLAVDIKQNGDISTKSVEWEIPVIQQALKEIFYRG